MSALLTERNVEAKNIKLFQKNCSRNGNTCEMCLDAQNLNINLSTTTIIFFIFCHQCVCTLFQFSFSACTVHHVVTLIIFLSLRDSVTRFLTIFFA